MKKNRLLVLGATLLLALTGCGKSAGESAYDIAVRNGFEGTEKEWLESLKGEKGDRGEKGDPGQNGQGQAGGKGDTGATGKSAYEIAVAGGYTGTEAQWLESLKGADGQPGGKGDAGAAGKSAYDLYLETVPDGEKPMTEAQWLASLKGDAGAIGKSAYDLYVENLPDGETPMTQSEWLESLKATNGLELQDLSFGRIYREMTGPHSIAPSDLECPRDDNFYGTYLLNDNYLVEEIYGECGDTSYKLEGELYKNDFCDISNGDYDYRVEEHTMEYDIEANFKNVKNGDVDDVIALFNFRFADFESNYEWNETESRYDFIERLYEHYDKFEFAIIDGEYYALTDCMEYVDDEALSELPGDWHCYYKFGSREEYVYAISTLVYFFDFASANGTIFELLCDYDFDEHIPAIGKIGLDMLLETAMYGVGYYFEEDGMEAYVYENVIKPTRDVFFAIEIATERYEGCEFYLFDYRYSSLFDYDSPSEAEYEESLERTSTITYDADVDFIPTTELADDRVNWVDEALGDPYLFLVGAVEMNLLEEMCVYGLLFY